jgi:hypothetical protein
MTPRDQLIQHDPEAGRYGDCQRTCVAAVLDLPTEAVPHFNDDPTATRDSDEWWEKRQARWLAGRGLAWATVAYSGEVPLDQVLDWTSRANPAVPMILLGTSKLGSNHVVVVLNGAIVCDPSGNGIVGPSKEGTWELSMICVGADWRGRTEPRP